MNSTPKQQDGDESGVAPASGARPSLEQTVLGVAPASAQAASAPPLASSAPPAVPPQLDVPAAPPPVELASAPAGAAAPTAAPVVVAAPVIVVAAPGPPLPPRPSEREPAATPLAPAVHATLPVTGPQGSPPPAPVAATAPVAAERGPTAAAPGLGSTLPVGALAPAASGPSPLPGAQRTALNDDYLREARQAALAASPEPTPAVAADATAARSAARASADTGAPPSSFGTRPSIVASPLPHSAPPSSTPESAPVGSSRGFEPVPVVRAPLAESLSGALGPVGEVGGHRGAGPASAGFGRAALPVPRAADTTLRWLLLAAVALVSIASVMVGQRIWHRYRARDADARPLASAASAPAEASAATARAVLPSRPAPEAAPPGHALVVSVSGGQPGDPAGPGSTNPESQLAATAGRHVIAGNFADALPLYQQLARAYPESSTYTAMARVLEQKVGASNDTQTVSPALGGVKR